MEQSVHQITQTIIKGLEVIAEEKKKELKGRDALPCNRELQAGFFSKLVIRYENSRIVFFLDPFDWSDVPDYKIKFGANPYTKEETKKLILPELEKLIQEHFLNDKYGQLYEYKLNVEVEIKATNGVIKQQFQFRNEEVQTQLNNSFHKFIDETIFGEFNKELFKENRFLFAQHLLDFQLHNILPSRVIEIIDFTLSHTLEGFDTLKAEFVSSLLLQFNEWEEQVFKPLYFNKKETTWGTTFSIPENFDYKTADEELVKLYVYKNYLGVLYGSYPEFSLKELETASKFFNSKKATQYLKQGSGKFSNEESNFQNELVNCSANDVLATLTIKIKEEQYESYQKALEFIIKLLKNGFPTSYKINFSSKKKNLLPIKGIAKSSTHRFFANCLEYSELHSLLEDYATIAMKEFAWYNDVPEGEKSVLPGSYAVFGLGLESERYFPLVNKYFKVLDDEHQLAHVYFIEKLIENFGITQKSLPVILNGITSAQFEKTFKSLTKEFQSEENLKLLVQEIRNFDYYFSSKIYYTIWGKNFQKKIQQLPSNYSEKLLRQLRRS